VAELFPSGVFPEGEMAPHGETRYPDPDSNYTRKGAAERRADDRLLDLELTGKLRHASEVHRQVRHYAQSFIRPGIDLADMCERIENCNRKLVMENGLQAGVYGIIGLVSRHIHI
jgi:methionyl aminopeptidase